MDINQLAADLFADHIDDAQALADRSRIKTALSALLGDDNGRIDLASIVSNLDAGGLAAMAQSWLGDGANDIMSTDSVQKIFGAADLDNFAKQLNLDTGTASSGLAKMLPELIDRSSRGGSLLGSALGDGLLGAAGKLFNS